MDYVELLDKAKKNLPSIGTKERLEVPAAFTSQAGKYTIVRNFSEIVKMIRRDPIHMAKFLFKELAIPGSIKNNELVLQGRVSNSLINQRVREYVKKFVECKECGKLDTVIRKEGRMYFIKCEVCGANRALSA